MVATILAAALAAGGVQSGPKPGEAAAELKVLAATGPDAGKEVGAGETAVVLFIPADKWDRPTHRYLKKIDQELAEAGDAAGLLAVWLTETPDKSKEYLPKVQESVNYQKAVLAVFKGESGPNGWGVNPDAHLTAVVVRGGKVAVAFGYRSVNESDAAAVLKAVRGK